MPMKSTSRTVWVLIVVIIAALFLYLSLAGRPAKPPQAQDEFPIEEAPPST
jgi:hypothetical protein